MMFGAPDNAPPNTARIPSIVVLGADALLAALPATPIQLAHACMRAGYQHVLPASWGDELIAAATLRELRNHSQAPAIVCSCPFVASRLLAVGTDLRPFLISLMAPPVVLARYLRAAYPQAKLRITFVGRCPGAADESIDARLTPEELLAIFADHHIDLPEQPDAFDSVIPPDRRRYRSQPGGLPAPEMLWLANANGGGARSLVELYGDELPVELAQHLLSGKPVLVDVAAKLGCFCSGATGEADPAQARARVVALEPPRASKPIIDEGVVVDAVLPLPASPRSAVDVIAPSVAVPTAPASDPAAPNDPPVPESPHEPAGMRAGRPDPSSPPATALGAVRRYSPARGVARLMTGGLPTARDADGRQLPRTYVARRRAPGRPPAKTLLEAETPIPTATEPATRSEQPIPTIVHGESQDHAPVETMDAAPVAESNSRKEESLEKTARVISAPTPKFDAEHPESAALKNAGDRPIIQLLTLGLLITMVVLISAAIGLVVGRWMTQR
jgi:hypothetical protein